MTAASLRRLGLYCGIASPVLWLGLIAVVGSVRPDFNHLTHYISELAARGSSTEALMRGVAFGFTGFLYLGFAAALLSIFPRGWMFAVAAVLIGVDGIGRMGAGVFPCDPGCIRVSGLQDLHKLFATIGFLAGILAAILWGVLFRGLAPLRALSWFSIGSGVVALAALLLMSWKENPARVPGLFELIATAGLSIWVFVFAARVIRTAGTAHRLAAHAAGGGSGYTGPMRSKTE
jgi:hypothetical membrane protein